jgi:hypothetical protein
MKDLPYAGCRQFRKLSLIRQLSVDVLQEIFSMKRNSAPARRPARIRPQDQGCQFEILEPRRLLAVAALDYDSGILSITYEAGESSVSIGNNNRFLMINGEIAGNTAPEPARIPLDSIRQIRVEGHATSAAMGLNLEFVDKFNQENSPGLQDVRVSDVNRVAFLGQLELAGNLVVATGPESGEVWQSLDGQLEIQGSTQISVFGGGINLSSPQNDFAGPVSIVSAHSTGEVRIVDTKALLLDQIDVEGTLRLKANTIRDSGHASIRVTEALFVKAEKSFSSPLEFVNSPLARYTGSIILGDSATDDLQIGKLNFKARGMVSIRADSSLLLIGSSYATNARLEASGSIDDAIFARTNVKARIALRAGEQIRLGDMDTCAFNAAAVRVVAAGSVAIHQQEDMTLLGVEVGGNLTASSGGNLTNSDRAMIEVAGDAVFSADSIVLGDSLLDVFHAGRLSFNSAGQVSIEAQGDQIVFGNNSAGMLMLNAAGGLLSDAAGSVTRVQDHSVLAGGAITWGRHSTFESNTLTLRAIGNITLHQSSDMVLTGINTANSFRLSSNGAISNRTGATIAAHFRLDLAAATIDLGSMPGDHIEFRSLRFDSTGIMNLHSDSDIRIVLGNHSGTLNLSSTGNIDDQPGAQVVVEGEAALAGVDIVLGDTGECFNVMSMVVVVNASGISDVTLGC